MPTEPHRRDSATDRSRFGSALAVSTVAVAAVAFSVFLNVKSGTPVAKRGSDVVLEIAALLAALACAGAARRGGTDARGWRLLAVAALVYAAGNTVWTVYGITRDFAYPFPSAADIGFLGWSVPAAVGLLRFPRETERLVSRIRTGLDALVIALSILFVSWATALGPLYRTASEGWLSRVTALAYPIVDITVASLVLALGMRRAAGSRLAWVLLGGGLVTLSVTDSIYVHRTVAGTYTAGTILNLGWPLAFLLLALAALVPERPSASAGHPRLGRIQEFVPYVPFLGALIVVAGKGLSPAGDPFLLVSGLACLVAYGVRQALIVTENLALSGDLQARVEERTTQLGEANDRLTHRSEAVALLRRISLAANEAPSVEGALQVAVDEVCDHIGWPVGHVCLLADETADEVAPTTIWHFDASDPYQTVRRAIEASPYVLGVGSPWPAARAGAPAWIDEATAGATFPRVSGRSDLAVRAGFVVPILAGRRLLGVLEFFSPEPAPADPALLELVAQVGNELGRVVERKRAEEALRDSEAHTRSILSAASNAFVGMDDEGLITDWNRSAESIFGWTTEEALGRSLAETIIPPTYRQAHADGLGRFLATGRGPALGKRLELSALRRDGREFPVELSIWNNGGERPSFSAFVQDITERRQGELALAQARDQALEASRAKSEFLATMSHEIRTPMNGVIGLTGLLLDTELTGTQRHHAEGVRASGEALLGIINDILDFSKIEAGKLELETVDFDLSHAVEEVAALVAESAQAKDLELVAYCRPEVPTALRGDVGRLRQILLNFATNAVKFTEAGEVVVRAGLDGEPEAERVVVRLEVVDTGVGVDPATAERLFDPFSQADASTTRRYGGTGLGLAICRRLAEAMGGTVGVDSRPAGGSTFWLRLPLGRAAEPLPALPRAGDTLAGRRVLVVDDNQTNRLVLGSQLRAWDLDADLVADGAEALVRLRAAADQDEAYDLALLDMAMPGMDGLELAAVIASDPALAGVRLLLLSSVSVEASVAASAGFVARLTKPVRLSALYDALVRAVTLPSAAAEAPSPAPAVVPGSRGRLLIVEDHAINQEVARGMAAKLGYGSDVAGDGIEALAALERRSYDAVLMDCHMPEMDGFEATAAIRGREAGRGHVPVIAMTAAAMVEDREKCIAAGMDDYLSKPVDGAELESVLKRWVGSEDQGRAEVEAAGPSTDGDGDDDDGDGGGDDDDGDGVLDGVQFDGLRQLAAASGDPGFLRSFVDQYLDQAGSQLAELREAARRGDAPALRDVAHGLKGTSSTMGARGVAAACAALEDAAARGEVAGPEGLDRVARELEWATTALRAAAPTD